MRFRTPLGAALLFASALFACSAPATEDADDSKGAIASNDAKILDFEFDGEVVTGANVEARKAIVSQLMYVQGILTTSQDGSGQIGNVKLSDVRETPAGEKKRVQYKASLPVAWSKYAKNPAAYELRLPRDTTAFAAFNKTYDGRCGKNAYGQEYFWHDWNPNAKGCAIDAADVETSKATVKASQKETSTKYPEYDAIWHDDRLDVVAIFGIFDSSKPTDPAYTESTSFIEHAKSRLTGASVEDNAKDKSILKDTTVRGTKMIGGRERSVQIDVLVVQSLASVGADFSTRYDALSEKADLIAYTGHSGMGKNLGALARKGKVAPGKYQIMLVNGCESFALLDSTASDRRRDANGASDPEGTKFLDVIGNALPGYVSSFASMPSNLYDAVVSADTPKSYSKILDEMPSEQMVVVFGEEDNRDP